MMMKFVSTMLLGFLSLSTGAFARRELNEDHGVHINQSSAKCEVIAIGYSKASNDDIIAQSSADAAAYICGGGVYHKTDADIAKDVAKGFALAVAAASAKCELEGHAAVYANAKAYAKAEAELWVTAWADAVASAFVCGKCSAYAHSWGYIRKHVFLQAIAHAEVKLDEYQKGGGPLVLKAVNYMKDVEVVVAKSFAVALAGAADYYKKDACAAWVNAGGCIWTEDHGDQCFECEAHAVSVGKIKEIDALAVAVASASAWTCGEYEVDYSEAEATAKSIAKAVAIAISYVYIECSHDGGGIACAWGDTYVQETARATALAFAQAWAEAYICKDTCYVEVDTVAEAVGDIVAKASADAWAYHCTKGGSFKISDFEVEIAKGSITAMAEALAAAISIGDHTCAAGGYVDVSAGR